MSKEDKIREKYMFRTISYFILLYLMIIVGETYIEVIIVFILALLCSISFARYAGIHRFKGE